MLVVLLVVGVELVGFVGCFVGVLNGVFFVVDLIVVWVDEFVG